MKLSLESQGASRCDVLVKSLLPGNRVWFSAPIVVKLVQIQQRFFFREATHQTDFSLRPAIPVAWRRETDLKDGIRNISK